MNKSFLVSTISAFSICTSISYADNMDELIKLLPPITQGAASAGLGLLPPSQKNAVSEYLELLGVTPSPSVNHGILVFNKKVLDSSPCFTDLVADFYLNIEIENKTPPPKLALISETAIPLSATPEDFGKKPGWLWDMALKTARGDKLLAMQLIGMCGHDDKNQLLGAQFPVSEAKNRELQQRADSANLRPYLGPECPRASSAFYGPQALGRGADIPQTLKNRISTIQAPTLGAKSLPAKNYHIMGAAFTSCYLVRGGLPGFATEKLAMGALNAYRSARICQKLQPVSYDFTTISAQQVFDTVIKIRSRRKVCEGVLTKTNEAICGMIYEIGSVLSSAVSGESIPEEIIMRKIRRALAEADARQLFNGTVQNESSRCQGVQLTDSVRKFLERNATSAGARYKCPLNLGAARCNAMREVLETYLTDFKWSEAQHMAGIKFAEANCPPYDEVNTPEVVACRILSEAQIKSSEPHSGESSTVR